jgi:uncharacterized protein YndB with AHSA1/START domain
MIPTGRLDGDALVLERRFTAPIGDVWASVTESDRLARWFGTWTGDPADGWVMVTMTAEAEPQPPVRYDIVSCEPPRSLAIRATDAYGTWHLSVELTEGAGGTTLQLRQHQVDRGSLSDTGPGWEWYLDRLVAAATDAPLPGLDDFERDYLALGPAYDDLGDGA